MAKTETLINILLKMIEKSKRPPGHPFFCRVWKVNFLKHFLWRFLTFSCNHQSVCYISMLQYHWILKHNFFPVSLYRIKHLRHSLKWAPRTQDLESQDLRPRTQDLGPGTHDPRPRNQDSGPWDPRPGISWFKSQDLGTRIRDPGPKTSRSTTHDIELGNPGAIPST